jgi:hypothetical protein
MTARRVVGSEFDAATYSTDPLPWPLEEPRMVSQAALELAVHAHSRAVVIGRVPLPPDAGTLSSPAGTDTPQRGTFAGAVDVLEEDPQPAPAAAAASMTKTATTRAFILNSGDYT